MTLKSSFLKQFVPLYRKVPDEINTEVPRQLVPLNLQARLPEREKALHLNRLCLPIDFLFQRHDIIIYLMGCIRTISARNAS